MRKAGGRGQAADLQGRALSFPMPHSWRKRGAAFELSDTGVLRCEAPSSLLGNIMLKRCCSSYTLTSHLLVQITSNLEKHREPPHNHRQSGAACGQETCLGRVGTRGTFSGVWRRRGPCSAKSRCRPPAVLACPLSLSSGPGSRRKQVSESLQMSRIFMLLPWLNLSLWGHLLGSRAG